MTTVLYLLTSPEPPIEGTDATFQEISALKSAFNGEVINLSPRGIPGRPFPPQLLGLHKLVTIRRLERRCGITHIYHSVLCRFPILRLLRKPIVYTVVASLNELSRRPNLDWFKSLHCIAVSNSRDAELLASWGVSNYAVVPPTIDISRIVRRTLDLRDEMTLLMASAPWVEEQFDLKGVDALLDAAVELPTLKLIFLWRGILLDELHRRVERRGLTDRVEIVGERVDIDRFLARSHATVLLAKRSDIVKAFPHSLLESLVGGKPVVLSAALPMADLVREEGCGVVLEAVNAKLLVHAIGTLRAHYPDLAGRARSIDSQRFSPQNMISKYREIYRSAHRS